MEHIVVVQQMHTYWTKESRGGENAVKRNSVPEVARVPVQRIPAKDFVLVHHLLSYKEENGFAPAEEKIRVNPTLLPIVAGCVTIRHSEDEAIAVFRYDRNCGGVPDRGWARKTLRMVVNEWGQIVYNGRFQDYDEGGWWYEKMVVNVGLFERLTPGMFTKQEPTCRFSAMGELF